MIERHFSSDWFSRNIELWERVVIPRLPKYVHWLELGCYEGRSACWTYDRLIASEKHGKGGWLTCVDAWFDPEVEKRFDANTAEMLRLTKNKAKIFDFCSANAVRMASYFDAIYIDGDHQAKAVIADACLSWHMLKPGGILIFDDYPWQQPDASKLPPGPGIDAFLTCWINDLQLLHKDWQVIIQKLK